MARAANTTIIKRIEESGHDGHHGGAWKVAYADFMTAMMAFFLLLWILSSSDEQKLKGIAEYFTDASQPGGLGVLDGASIGPPGILSASNGAIMARGSEIGEHDQTAVAKWEVRDMTDQDSAQLPESDNAALKNSASTVENSQSEAAEALKYAPMVGSLSNTEDYAQTSSIENSDETGQTAFINLQAIDHTPDNSRFEELQAELLQAMQENPDLRPLKKNIIFEKTNSGLRIQVIDQEGQPMFASGSANMLPVTRQLLSELGRSLANLPNQLVITGHTDSVPFSGNSSYDNWDLSTDRANEARRMLVNAGVDRERLLSVSGKAHIEPLIENAPNDPSNRRITLFLQYSDAANMGTDPNVQSKTDRARHSEGHNPATDVSVLDQKTLENIRSVLR